MKFRNYVVVIIAIVTFGFTIYEFAFVTEDVKVNITDREVSPEKVTLWVSLINGGSTTVQLSDLQLRVVKDVQRNLWDTEDHECKKLAGEKGLFETHLPDDPNWPHAAPNSIASQKLEYTFDPPFSTPQSVAFCLYIEVSDIQGRPHSIVRDGFRVVFDERRIDKTINIFDIEEPKPLVFDVIKRSRKLYFR